MKSTHLIGVCIFPVGFKQMTHGHLIAFVICPVTLTIQVQGVLVNATVIHDAKSNVHLRTFKCIHILMGSNVAPERPVGIIIQCLCTSVEQDSELEL